MRLCAIAAMLHYSGNAEAAVPLFKEYCPDHGLTEGLQDFCTRWWKRYQDRQDGECFLRELPRTGRPRKLQPADIAKAAKLFSQGYYSHGVKKYFTSLDEVSGMGAEAH